MKVLESWEESHKKVKEMAKERRYSIDIVISFYRFLRAKLEQFMQT